VSKGRLGVSSCISSAHGHACAASCLTFFAQAIDDPIRTHCSNQPASNPTYIELNASLRISLAAGGSRFLHGWIDFRFDEVSSTEKQKATGAAPATRKLELRARARQFSSFVLMIGTLPAQDAFEPR
jgi:hypothetical protein